MTHIQRYDARTKSFEQPVNYKVKKLLELGLIKKINPNTWAVLPIPGYNRTEYTIRERFGALNCNCQKGRKGHECSHIQAVRIYRQKTEEGIERQIHFV